MNEVRLGEFSELLLLLYRRSIECELDEFQDEALRLIKRHLSFDSCMWGTATYRDSGIDIHSIHLHNQPPEMIEAYEAIKHLDKAAAAVARTSRATLSFNSASCFTEGDERQFADFNRRFEQRNYFITSAMDPDTRFTHWVSLFRAESDAYGTENECRLLDALAPHLQQALGHNRIAHLARLKSVASAVNGSAIADARGIVYHIERSFADAVRSEWNAWRPGRLPQALTEHFSSGQRKYVGRTSVVTCHVDQELLFLHSRPRQLGDDLSPKELQVARLMMKGHTHKEVAAELGRAPATVRNHMQSIYGKLRVNSIGALVNELQRIS